MPADYALEGREDFETFASIVEWRGILVNLTRQAGVVTVQSDVSTVGFRSFKSTHIDNPATPVYLDDAA